MCAAAPSRSVAKAERIVDPLPVKCDNLSGNLRIFEVLRFLIWYKTTVIDQFWYLRKSGCLFYWVFLVQKINLLQQKSKGRPKNESVLQPQKWLRKNKCNFCSWFRRTHFWGHETALSWLSVMVMSDTNLRWILIHVRLSLKSSIVQLGQPSRDVLLGRPFILKT